MHGGRWDPEIPMFGNKVLGVRYGILDIHGVPRRPYWTTLSKSALIDDTTITIDAIDCDWEINDQIIIAPTCNDPA